MTNYVMVYQIFGISVRRFKNHQYIEKKGYENNELTLLNFGLIQVEGPKKIQEKDPVRK